ATTVMLRARPIEAAGAAKGAGKLAEAAPAQEVAVILKSLIPTHRGAGAEKAFVPIMVRKSAQMLLRGEAADCPSRLKGRAARRQGYGRSNPIMLRALAAVQRASAIPP